MRKIIEKEKVIRYSAFFAILILALTALIIAHGAHVQTREVKLYFIDAEMLRLVPVKMTVPDNGNTEQMARRVLDELIKGRDDNPKIRRLIPNIKRCMTVHLEGDTAYVDLKQTLVENHPDGRDLELLTVYSIVNTLTALDGIKTVRFTVAGRMQKDFMGHLDMREVFVPDYFI